MDQSIAEQRTARRLAYANYLNITYGYDSIKAKGDSNAFCKDLYELGQIDAPERSEGFKPRSAPLLEVLTGKFQHLNFGWKNDESKGALIIFNTPRIGGRQLGLYEMLVVPVELCDPPGLDLTRKRNKQVKPKVRNPAVDEQQFGWHFDGA